MSGWSDSLNFLRAGDFGRTRPLSVSAFPRVYCRTVPRPFKGATIERTACMTRSTELDGDAENGLMLRFRRQQGRRAPKGWRELSSIYEERGISTTFVGWLLCDFNREMCRKDTNNGDWTIHRRRKEAQVEKNKRFPLTCCRVRHFRGRISKKPVNAVQEHVTEWAWKRQVDRDSCRSTCSPSTLSELSPHTRHNQNNRR